MLYPFFFTFTRFYEWRGFQLGIQLGIQLLFNYYSTNIQLRSPCHQRTSHDQRPTCDHWHHSIHSFHWIHFCKCVDHDRAKVPAAVRLVVVLSFAPTDDKCQRCAGPTSWQSPLFRGRHFGDIPGTPRGHGGGGRGHSNARTPRAPPVGSPRVDLVFCYAFLNASLVPYSRPSALLVPY